MNMPNITYKVKYRKFLIWKTLKGIKADGIIDNKDIRYFINDKEERIEIPMTYMFKFSKERNIVIQQNSQQ